MASMGGDMDLKKDDDWLVKDGRHIRTAVWTSDHKNQLLRQQINVHGRGMAYVHE
ncbi:uncharacterized protein LACBIDRAFT_308526 [Laccaria bicolor S238N-H82]|uniref:Predicted protein n=1 Tax=Laccaria bicolor (strain S238N-H82 / ATCC MYA-4686) TaxID=486041 RepID=B0CWK2_LACBS|nr:uncharacterized protein LACBIDRAFT_308526 [Laccaria bicolor S238N-H82]EDR13525.1 predicted protein [Laccaria bicolor S238N-H82]|eukprot:XP_001876023.1 predicted protein [Laccaria bicolor S238N-H82]